MRGAEPTSRGRMSGRPGVDASAAEAKRLRDAQRVRRYRDRQAMGQAVGRFLITEDLVTALIASGELRERDAMTKAGIEEAMGRVLSHFIRNLPV